MKKSGSSKTEELYCICRKPDDGELMVQCEKCEEWFHWNCVSDDPDEEEVDDEWMCSSCEKAEITQPAQVVDQVDLPQDMATDTPHSLRPSRNQAKCLLPSCQNRTRADSYCSDVCAQKDAKRNEKEFSNDKEYAPPITPPSVRTDRRQSASESRKPATPKKKPVLSLASGGGSSNGGSAPNSPTLEKGASSGSNDENIRKNVVKNMTSVLKVVFEAALKKTPGLQLTGQSQTDKDEKTVAEEQPSVQDMAEKLAKAIEKAMYDHLGDAQPGKSVACGARYKDKFRSLLYNLKDKANENFQLRVITGDLAVDELVQMSSEDMANPELKSMSEALREKSIINSVLRAPNMPIIKKTHKGDFIMTPDETDRDVKLSSTARMLPSPAKSPTETESMQITTAVSDETGMDTSSRKSSTTATPTTPTVPGRQYSLDDILARIGVPNEPLKRFTGNQASSEFTKKRKVTVDLDEIFGDDDTPFQLNEDDDAYVPQDTAEAQPSESSSKPIDKNPVIWEGSILYKSPELYTKFNATARLIGGRTLSSIEASTVLPPKWSVIGRVSPDKVESHIDKVTRDGFEVSLLEIEASRDEKSQPTYLAQSQAKAQTLVRYLSTLDRYGVIKDGFYLVPLKVAENVPDFMYAIRGGIRETKRNHDLFLGILVFRRDE